jgi:hypothetical protein
MLAHHLRSDFLQQPFPSEAAHVVDLYHSLLSLNPCDRAPVGIRGAPLAVPAAGGLQTAPGAKSLIANQAAGIR